MLYDMLANKWTTLLGILTGFITYLASAGAVMPTNKAEWLALLRGAAIAGLGIVAKDATTGSKPT